MNCPICNRKIRKKVNGLFYCEVCSLTFDSKRTKPKYYEDCSTYKPGIYNTFGNYMDIARIIIPFLSKKTYILEIGCGDGNLLLELREKGYKNVNACEVNKHCIDYLKGKKISMMERNKKYEFIVLSHVIEHVDDLWSLKKFVDSVSSKKALLFVEAPNRRQYAQYYKNIYSNREHINNFDIFSIRRLFKDWSVVSFGERTANFNTYAVAWCLFSKKSLEEEYEKKYFKEVERMLNEGGREFVAWGAGEFAVQIIKKYKPKIKYFVDTFKHDSTLFGYKIYKPEKILEYKGSLVVLSTTKQEEIKRAAIKMGFKGKIVLF